MKTVAIDHLDNSGEWLSGVLIRNTSHRNEPVFVRWCTHGQQPSQPIFAEVAPWGIYTPALPAKQTGSMVIAGPDQMSVVATTRIGWNSCFQLTCRWTEEINEFAYPYPPNSRTPWTDSPFWKYLELPTNEENLSAALPVQVVQYAAMEIYFQFPVRFDSRMGVYDACPANGNSPEHPGGSHTSFDGLGLDVSYYTTDVNDTKHKSIWSGDALNLNIFDLERNKTFFWLIHKYLPSSVIMVDQRIKAALGNPAYIQGDAPGQWGHDWHAHITLGASL